MSIYYFYQQKKNFFLFLFLFLTSHIYSQTGLQFDGIDDYVTFGEATGANGTLMPSGTPPNWVNPAGILGASALQFSSASSQYVSFGPATSTLGTSTFTLECRIYKTGNGTTTSTGTGGITAVPIITKGRGQSETTNLNMNYFFGITSAGILTADFEDKATGLNHPITGTTVLSNNVWYHIAATYDGTTWRIFLDGDPEATLVVGAYLPENTSIQHAGLGTAMTSTGTAQGFFDGIIDEARIWNYARTQGEISGSMNSEIESAPGLLGRWGMNEGIGVVVSTTANPKLGLSIFTIETWFKRTGDGVKINTGGSPNGVLAVPLITKGRGEGDGPFSNIDMNYFLGIGTDQASGTPSDVLVADFEDLATSSGDNNHPIEGVTPIVNDVWYHAAVTYDGSNWNLYLNGNLENTESEGNATPTLISLQHAGLGTAMTSDGTAAGFFEGMMDEIRIWDYARSQTEIQDAMYQEITSANGLVARYGLNEGSGTDANNSNSNNLTPGTLTGGPLWATTFESIISFQDGINSYSGTKDTYIYSAVNADNNYGAHITMVSDINAGDERRSLLSFDISNIPTGASITSATLQFYLQAEGEGFNMHRMLDPWEEGMGGASGTTDGGVTWNNVGNAEGSVDANWPGDLGYLGFISVSVPASTIQDWKDGILANNGWLMIATHPSNGQQLYTRDYGTLAHRPRLVVFYNAAPTTPPEAPTGLIVTSNTATQVGLSWADNSNNETSFDIERSTTSSTSGFTNIGSVAANVTTYNDNTVNELTDYWYRVVATNIQGSSVPSNVVNVTTLEELNYALQFDGSDDYVTFGQATQLRSYSFTIECWVNKNTGGVAVSTGTNGISMIPILTKGGPQGENNHLDANYILGISGGKIAVDFEQGVASTGTIGSNWPLIGNTSITEGNWYHIAATFDSTSRVYSLYVNGILDTSHTLPSGIFPEGQTLQYSALGTMLRSDGAVGGGYFSGIIDEARVWNYARSQSEIQNNMSNELTSGTGLLGRWGLNEGSGTIASNSVSGSPAGTLINSPIWVTPGFPSSGTTIVSFQEGVNGYNGTLDTYLSTLEAGIEHGLTDTHFEWDQWESGNQDMPAYGLLKFENIFGSSVNQIPSNASIISATLEYTITTDPGDQGILKEATSDWDESTTLNNFSGDPLIQGSTIAVAPSTTGTHGIDVTNSISSWVGNSSLNKGWIFVPTETDGTSAVSSEDGTQQNRPKLTVSYLIPTDIPDAPVATAASNISTQQFQANWESSSQATSYRLDVSENNSFTNILPGYDDLNVGNNTNYTVTGLSLLTDYYYRVRAENTLGTSGNSNTIPVTTTDVADALFLDGSDSYVRVDDGGDLGLASFTIETWFKKQGPGKLATETGTGGLENVIPLVTKGSAENEDLLIDINYFLCITASNTIAADFEDHDNSQNYPTEGVTTINDNQWYHAAVTYDGNRLNLYLNGNLESFRDIGLPPAYESLTPVALGSCLQSNGNVHANFSGYFDGTLDEVRIWDYARSQSEIQSTINSQIVTAQTGLVARWALDEGTGTLVTGSAGTTFNGTIVNNNYQWVAGAPFNLGNAPFEPVLVSPANGETVSDFPELQVTVTDPNSDNLTVTFYGREIVAGPPFSLIGLPDTQFYSESFPNIFLSQTQWIVANKDNLNIAFVSQFGDCVQNGDNNGDNSEWLNADAALSELETIMLPDGMPFGVAVGNHDQSPIGDADGTTDFYNFYFGESRFFGRAYYGGHYDSNNDNHYELFSASGLDFIIIHLEYDTSPDQLVLDWADGLLAANPGRRAIVVTHNLLGTGNPGMFSAQGQAIYDALKDNSNLFLMLGGHVSGEGRRTDTFNGNTVHSILADYQSRTNGGNGWLRIHEFVPAMNEINVKTYSPYLNQFESDGDSEFSLNYNMTGSAPEAAFEILASFTNVISGSTVSHTWTTGITGGSTYQWYVELDDQPSNPTPSTITKVQSPSSVTTGPIWSFSTDAGLPVELSLFTAFMQGTDIELNWRTETEVNNYGFEILRQAQEDEWVKIGFVDGYGNSNSPKEYRFTDKSPAGGKQFSYKLKQIDNDGQFSYSSVVEVIITPNDFALYQNYPNPFNPTTTIKYSLPRESVVTIKIYDVLGSEVKTLVSGKQEAGNYEIEFDASIIASGMYIYRMQAGSFVQIKKMMILK